MKKVITETVETCGNCHGKGFTVFSDCVDYHRRNKISCYDCSGSGLFHKTVTTVLVPYNPRQAFIDHPGTDRTP